MKYNLEDIFNQAKEDDYAISLDGDGYESRMVYGAKIVKDTQTGDNSAIKYNERWRLLCKSKRYRI